MPQHTDMPFFIPQESERLVCNFYFKNNVVEEIKSIKSVWCDPSDKLIDLCRDIGTIQMQHTDLEKLISNDNENTKTIVYEACFKTNCGNCIAWGFPCDNACFYGNINKKLSRLWTINQI
jgi:hypothetical protein